MLLPRTIDNDYRGRAVALWIFGLLTLVRLAMSVNTIANGRVVAAGADGIPLDSYPPAAAQTIVALFAIWGLAHLLLGLGSLLVLVRYRSFVPFMFLAIGSEHLLRRLILRTIPIVRTGNAPAGYINRAILILTVIGFALSLWNRRRKSA